LSPSFPYLKLQDPPGRESLSNEVFSFQDGDGEESGIPDVIADRVLGSDYEGQKPREKLVCFLLLSLPFSLLKPFLLISFPFLTFLFKSFDGIQKSLE